MRIHTTTLRTGLLLPAMLVAAAALASTPALAAEGHGLLSSFDGGDAPGGPIAASTRVAVDQTTADVYVAVAAEGGATGVVDRFTSTGAYVTGSQLTGTPAGCTTTCPLTGPSVGFNPTDIAVDPSTGDVYVIDREHRAIDRYSSSGTFVLQFGGGTIPAGTTGSEGAFEPNVGIAVDPATHDVYVADEAGAIDELTPAGAYVSQLPIAGARAIAINASGTALYILAGGQVEQYSTTGVAEAAIDSSGSAQGVAVDPASGDIYVDDTSYIAQYDSAGAELNTFGEYGAGALGYSESVAVDGSTNRIYTSERIANNIDIYTPGPTPAQPTTQAASAITPTTATLNGTLNPAGTKTGFYFEYNQGTSCTGGSKTAVAETQGAVHTTIEGLEPSAQYTFCLVAINAYGHTTGTSQTFPTGALKPTVEGESATAVATTTTTLEAQVNPENQPTECKFEYGLTAAADETASTCEQGATPGTLEGDGNQTASANLTGLAPATVYHYRIVVANPTGPTIGAVDSFTTLPLPPQASTGQATPAASGAGETIAGRATPDGNDIWDTTYEVQYGPSTTYGSQIQGDAGTGDGTVSISATIPELQPGEVYHYRVIAKNAGGEGIGPDETFTAPGIPPLIGSQTAQFVNEDSAVIEGELNPEGLPVTYEVQYGTSTSYGASAPAALLGPFTSAQGTITPLADLTPGTTYHYRLLAGSAAGESYGPDETFTTAGATPTSAFTSFTVPSVPLIAVPLASFPGETPTATSAPKALTTKQKLAKALGACRKKSRRSRVKCERQARKTYGATEKKKR
jgi:hypothetical protein